jgi:hypothetical protein
MSRSDRASTRSAVPGAVAIGCAAVVTAVALVALAVPRLAPLMAHHWLLEGRARMEAHEVEQAVEAFRNYVAARPRDPIGHFELGLALDAACGTRACPEVLQSLAQAGLGPAELEVLGDESFAEEEWSTAGRWYDRALRYSLQPPDLAALDDGRLMRRVLASALGRQPSSAAYAAEAARRAAPYQARVVTDSLRLAGGDLFWLSAEQVANIVPGTSIGFPFADTMGDSGALWWNGEAAALVQIDRPGRYRVAVETNNSAPPPISLEVGIGDGSFTRAELAAGDDSPAVVAHAADLEPGAFLIRVRFKNNALVDGADRNLWIRAIGLEREQSPGNQG